MVPAVLHDVSMLPRTCSMADAWVPKLAWNRAFEFPILIKLYSIIISFSTAIAVVLC